MHKCLLAVATCFDHKFVLRASAQKATWGTRLHKAPGLDLRFFRGICPSQNIHLPDCLDAFDYRDTALNVDDSYAALPQKIRAICRWALDEGYDFLFKTDDDTYIVPENLILSGFEQHHYSGAVRPGFSGPYASGYAYWLSRTAMEVVAKAELTDDCNEDRWVGAVLAASMINAAEAPDYYKHLGQLNPIFIWRPPSRIGHAAVFAELTPELMTTTHKYFLRWGEWYLQHVRKPKRRPGA